MLATLAELAGWRRKEVASGLPRMSVRLLPGGTVDGPPPSDDLVHPPPSEDDYPERDDDCEATLRPGFLRVAHDAGTVGCPAGPSSFAGKRQQARLQPDPRPCAPDPRRP